jgi:hypothetical protein
VGDSERLLTDRPASLARAYALLERAVRGYGGIEIVTRDRYALFRTTRIFADLTVTRDAMRVVIHLDREVTSRVFVQSGRNGKRVSHVAFVRTATQVRAILPYLRDAYDLAIGESA